jgi:hypothetical protein
MVDQSLIGYSLSHTRDKLAALKTVYGLLGELCTKVLYDIVSDFDIPHAAS